MFLLYEVSVKRQNVNVEISGLEVVHTLRRAVELKLATPFVIYQFSMRQLLNKIYCIYVIRHNRKCVHTSHVIGKVWRFPFMGAGDIEIGPCWTATEYRRRGFYTAVIQRILYDFRKHRAWMLTHEANIASIRGIKKEGLNLAGKGRRTKPFGFRFFGRFVFRK